MQQTFINELQMAIVHDDNAPTSPEGEPTPGGESVGSLDDYLQRLFNLEQHFKKEETRLENLSRSQDNDEARKKCLNRLHLQRMKAQALDRIVLITLMYQFPILLTKEPGTIEVCRNWEVFYHSNHPRAKKALVIEIVMKP